MLSTLCCVQQLEGVNGVEVGALGQGVACEFARVSPS